MDTIGVYADAISFARLLPRMLASCNPVGAIRKLDVIAICRSVNPEYLDAISSDLLEHHCDQKLFFFILKFL